MTLDSEEDRDAWVDALETEIARHRAAVSGMLKVSEGVLKMVGDQTVQQAQQGERHWKKFHYRLLMEADKGYATLAYYENWDTKVRDTVLAGDLRLIPSRVSILDRVESGGVVINYAFELVSPKKSMYFMGVTPGTPQEDKDMWVRALQEQLELVQQQVDKDNALRAETDSEQASISAAAAAAAAVAALNAAAAVVAPVDACWKVALEVWEMRRAEAEKKAKAEHDERVKQAEMERAEIVKREADARAKAEADAKARAEAEEKARAEAEEKARRDAEEKAKRAAEAEKINAKLRAAGLLGKGGGGDDDNKPCPKCGKMVPAGSKFCTFCGAPMDAK